ncbi:DUF423 domain-containing protein [Gloeobacter morelensis]|uniref:DUF423 domain-containing protein n=1 Tax=Gloeobacter morelensis MG652769 TaxID=2781736 RepID=A0ABY3PU60_9CYAN|nr:DUF423 domain-containing protein [Gloeobacter morelensis]UFP97064.1 DUF423 domain-containing protein [Gloeobacter morelensis MG652769]
MFRLFLTTAAVFGGLAVALGAFGAHALRERLDAQAIEIFETAARYQILHALALGLVAVLAERFNPPSPLLLASGTAFIAGILIFSGSLYALSISGIRILGAITPFGGAALIAGWICLALFSANLK